MVIGPRTGRFLAFGLFAVLALLALVLIGGSPRQGSDIAGQPPEAPDPLAGAE